MTTLRCLHGLSRESGSKRLLLSTLPGGTLFLLRSLDDDQILCMLKTLVYKEGEDRKRSDSRAHLVLEQSQAAGRDPHTR